MSIIKKTIVSAVCGMALLPLAASAQGWPSQYKGVMLQGFYWDSFEDSQWTKLENQADELAPYFRLIWIPQSAYCGGKSMGYNPLYWFSNYNSSFGTEAQLRSMIGTFKQKGIGTIADVVINHRGTLKNWFDFPVETYNGKTYQMYSTDVCANDDSGKAATQAQKQGVSLSQNKDSGEDWSGMRDLDHNSANVQSCVKDYLHMLLNDFGYAGFRYDMTKGYSAKFTGIYNTDAKPEYSVGEYWDGNKSVLMNWLNGTKVDGKIQSATFDFAIRYTIRDAANNGNWAKLADGGLATNDTYKRYAVTFIENHDTEKRSDSAQDPIRKDTLAAYGYLLAASGTPCVFYKHWIDHKADLKNMILLRNRAGIHNESKMSKIQAETGLYVFSSTGTDGELCVAVGSKANKYTAPAGYALAAEGYHWRYFLDTKQETAWPSLPSGVYYNEPEVTLRAISAASDARVVYTLDGSEPTVSSAQVANGNKVILPSGNITLKVGVLADGRVSGVTTRTYEVRKFSPYQMTVYVNTDKVGWNNCYFWTWGGDGTHGAASGKWPGDNHTTTTEVNGKKWYSQLYSINSANDCVSFVFAQKDKVQTVDVSGVTSTSYFEVLADKDSQGHYFVKDVTKDYNTAIAGITVNNTSLRPTTVVSLDGRTLRRFCEHKSTADALNGLAKGIYVVNGKKVVVK